MSSPAPRPTGSLIGNVLRLYRRLLGRKFYWLVVLMPLVSLAEAFGITLLLPLIASLDKGSSTGALGEGVFGKMLSMTPLPESPTLLLVLIACAFVIKGLFQFGVRGFAAVMQARLMYGLKAQLVQAYTALNFPSFARKNTGHYINVVTSQTSMVGQAFQVLVLMLTGLIGALVYLCVAAVVNWHFALVALVAGAGFILAMRQIGKYVAKLSRQTVAEQTILNTHLVQVLHALKYLIATDTSERLSSRVKDSCERLFVLKSRTGVAAAFATSVREPASVILLVFLIGVQLIMLGQPIANILVALILLDRATKSIFGLQSNWQRAMELVGATDAVIGELKFVNEEREERGKDSLTEFRDSVEFRGVSFAYNADDGDVLRRLNLEIRSNTTTAIVGPSGAGKSTIADLLTLLLRPTGGEILIDGTSTSNIDPRSWRREIGYVCQETVVFDDSVAANICLDATAYREDEQCRIRVRAAAESAFAAEFIDAMPDGFDTIVGDRGVRLSGGQCQRLFIARELYKQPALLLLDEATSALDGESEKAIQASIEALHGRVTVVVIAHRLSTIKNADRIYVMDHGEAVEHGSYAELAAREDSRFRRMVSLQSL